MTFLCQMCCQEAVDATHLWEVHDDEVWVYCRACDAWTSHPLPDELRSKP